MAQKPTALGKLWNQRTAYAQTWSDANAAKFEKDGHYQWMASFVDGFTKVLEIGTGDGRGTLELLRRGHIVVSIDENLECLQRAEERIRKAGLPVALQRRERLSAFGQGYTIAYPDAPRPFPSTGALLFEGDVLNDSEFYNWCGREVADCVTCWLLGSHEARQFNADLARFEIKNSGHYRLKVENMVYELADAVLRRGGILHIVDRGEVDRTPELHADVVGSHRDQASVTYLVVDEETPQRLYEDPPDGLRMGVTLPLSGRKPDMGQLALTSIIARAPS